MANISPKLIEDMHQKLNDRFTREEVEDTLRQMAPLKALGPDDFGAGFFHKHWKVVGKDVCVAVLKILHGAFLSGCFISDNILVAYELLHSMQAQKKGSTGRMTIKINISKAYDRIEWPYLEVFLHALGFQS